MKTITAFVKALWNDQRGQTLLSTDFILAVILVLVVGTVRLVGSNANNVFFFRLEFSSVSVWLISPVRLRVPKASGMVSATTARTVEYVVSNGVFKFRQMSRPFRLGSWQRQPVLGPRNIRTRSSRLDGGRGRQTGFLK